MPTGYPGLLIAAPRTADADSVGAAIDEIAALCIAGDMRALDRVSALVPELTRDALEPAA